MIQMNKHSIKLGEPPSAIHSLYRACHWRYLSLCSGAMFLQFLMKSLCCCWYSSWVYTAPLMKSASAAFPDRPRTLSKVNMNKGFVIRVQEHGLLWHAHRDMYNSESNMIVTSFFTDSLCACCGMKRLMICRH